MRPGRQLTAYYSRQFAPPFNRFSVGCSAPVLSELIGSLELYSEVKSIGHELLKAHGHHRLGESFLQFQAYIRQAKTFFEGAQALHHRASPLNYYYAFMNFAKAYIFLRTPGFVDNKLVHGLYYRAQTGTLRKQSIHVNRTGVFPLFYELVTGAKCNANSKLKIVDLLGYVSDVSFEFGKLSYGSYPYFRCRFAIGVNTQSNTAFPVIAVQKSGRDPSTANFRLEKLFDHVDLNPNATKALFDIGGEEAAAFKFFEGKEYPAQEFLKIPADVASALSGILSYNPVDEPFLLVLNERIKSPKLAPMQELLAIFCCMFYLGSLVRYRPDLLEAMLSKKDAWIIERFTKAAPLAFLRHIRNLIDGQYLAFHGR
jgi:YaaC-like Protein